MKTQKIPFINEAVFGFLILLSLLGSAIIAGCNGVRETTPASFDPDFRLIVPETTVVSGAGDIDGLNSDAKWNDAFSLDLIDGATVSGVILEGVADSSNLFLYFEIEESDFSSTDMVAIAINPSSTATDNRLLLIKPCPTGTAGCPSTDDDLPVDIDYFLDANDDGVWEPASGHGVTAKTATSGGIVWTVEVMIPRGAPFNLPATGYFGLYTNVLETTSFSIAAQYTWPFNNDAGSTLIFGTPEDTPADSVWGNATLDTSIGNGVRISSSDVSTNHGSSTISWNEPNEFYATAHNSTLTSGSLVSAEDVRATFRWKNFGLPSYSSFQLIPSDAAPAAGNPTGYVDILPTASETYQLDWTVPVADQSFYQTNRHWCVKVELDSTNPATVFYRDEVQVNMDFVDTSSPFVAKAVIDASGYKLPEGSRVHNYILEERFYNFDPRLKWKSELEGVSKMADATYKMNISPEKPLDIGLKVLPPAEALVPFKEISIKAAKAGDTSDPTKLRVKPGQLVTLLTEQEFKQMDADRNELADNDNRHQTASARLYASWDGFKESRIFVGGNMSLKVPEGVTALLLNVEKPEKADMSVDSMRIRSYVTDMEEYHLRSNSALKLNRDRNGIVQLGANLPTVIYRGKRDMGRTITIDKKTFKVHQSAGAFGYIVRGRKTGN